MITGLQLHIPALRATIKTVCLSLGGADKPSVGTGIDPAAATPKRKGFYSTPVNNRLRESVQNTRERG
jgi:hypothetical protein